MKTQLTLAAAMWSTVGPTLFAVGTRWLWRSHLGPIAFAAGCTMAVALGAAKARFMLDRTAGRIASRIQTRGDGRCLGGFLSWKSWALVGAMATTGRLLRATSLPLAALGFLYATVGAALLIASRLLWRARASAAVQ